MGQLQDQLLHVLLVLPPFLYKNFCNGATAGSTVTCTGLQQEFTVLMQQM